MNRIIVAALAALLMLSPATASTGPSAATGETKDSPAATAPSADEGFKVTMLVIVNGEPVFDIDFPHAAFATEDECKAFMLSGDEGLHDFVLTLGAVAHEKIAPRFQIGGACVPTKDETPGDDI